MSLGSPEAGSERVERQRDAGPFQTGNPGAPEKRIQEAGPATSQEEADGITRDNFTQGAVPGKSVEKPATIQEKMAQVDEAVGG